MMASMRNCVFSTMHVPWPWIRQTLDGHGRMTDCDIQINTNDINAQWLVVFDEPYANTVTSVPKERRILFITEPPEVKPYPASYLRQFGKIVSPFTIKSVPSDTVLIENPCLNWHYGVETVSGSYSSEFSKLDDFRDMPIPAKEKMLSVICSTKTYTTAQRKRIAFVEKLQARLGSKVDIYGRGRNPISDKQDAIAPYKYHLVLENNYSNFFWTEKLSDTLIGFSYPIYLGAPNLGSFFPKGFLSSLKPDSDEANIALIEKLLTDDPWERSLSKIVECRNWILETTNVFDRVNRFIREGAQAPMSPNHAEPVQIKPTGRWEKALLRRVMRMGLYNPFV